MNGDSPSVVVKKRKRMEAFLPIAREAAGTRTEFLN